MTPEQSRLCEEHIALARRRAAWACVGKPPHVRSDDLLSAALEGLTQAALRYRPGAGASFPTWARRRIDGAITDEMRAADILPRAMRRRLNAAEQPFNPLEPLGDLDVPHDGHEDACALAVTLTAVPLSARLRQVLQDYIDGVPAQDTARVIGVSASRITQLRAELWAALKPHLSD